MQKIRIITRKSYLKYNFFRIFIFNPFFCFKSKFKNIYTEFRSYMNSIINIAYIIKFFSYKNFKISEFTFKIEYIVNKYIIYMTQPKITKYHKFFIRFSYL